MDLEKFTERSRGFISSAQQYTQAQSHQQFSPLHLLKVMLDDPEGIAAALIESSGGHHKTAVRHLEAELHKLPKVQGDNVQTYLSSEMAKLMDDALKLAEKSGDSAAVSRTEAAFTVAYVAEMATGRPEYLAHRNTIDRFRAAATAK